MTAPGRIYIYPATPTSMQFLLISYTQNIVSMLDRHVLLHEGEEEPNGR